MMKNLQNFTSKPTKTKWLQGLLLFGLCIFLSEGIQAQITTFPYSEDFEAGDGGWTTPGTLWELGTPANDVIIGAASGVNAWVTDLDADYPIDADEQLLSPVFDFTGFTDDPLLTLDVWWQSENSWDGAVLQSSIDGGVTWQNVGAFGDPNNWFTDDTINSAPGGSMEGWTGRDATGSGAYVPAAHLLNGLAGQAAVQLRVAFGSDGSVNDNGFAFDNISITTPPPPPVVAPYGVDFENGGALPDGLTITLGDFPWTINEGTTTSGGTGPTGDNTPPDSAGFYLYTEASNGVPTGAQGILETPMIDISSLANPRLNFAYHMFGATMGNLDVELVEGDGTVTNVFNQTGQLQTDNDDAYALEIIDLTPFTGPIQLRFIATRGDGFNSDIAIDDINVFSFDDNDLAINNVTVPASAAVGESLTFSMNILNNGALPQSNFDVTYTADGATVTETFTGMLNTLESAAYTFTTPFVTSTTGDITIDFNVVLPTDTNMANNTEQGLVTVVPVISTYPYSEDFEAGTGGWTTGGALWERGTPAGATIIGASSGVNAFATDLDADYPGGANETIESPFLDFSGFTEAPAVIVDVWWNSEFSWDGTVLQSTIDGGTTWQNVGAFGDPFNWYNDDSINGDPGAQEEGWTGRESSGNGSGGFVQAAHLLDGLEGQANVRLRFAFGADGSVNDDGFAFDDVRIRLPQDQSLVCTDIVMDNLPGLCSAIVTYDIPEFVPADFPTVVGDAVVVQMSGLPSGVSYPVGTTTNVFETTAPDGEVLTCSFDVIVLDVEAPVVVCSNDVTVVADESIVILADYTTDATATDNCTTVTLTQDPAPGTEIEDDTTVLPVTITATDDSGNAVTCTFDVTFDFSLATDTFNLENGITLFPNPTNGIVNLSNDSNIALSNVVITDINGRVIQTIAVGADNNDIQISLEGYSSGIYLAQISTENTSIVLRIIKE